MFDVPRAGDALGTLLDAPDFGPGGVAEAVWMPQDGADSPRRVMASLECDRGTLTLRTLSRERAQLARSRLHELLGPLAVRSEHYGEPGALPLPADRSGEAAGPIDLDAIPELAAWRDQKDREWLDQEIPALEGLTPRQAARERRLKPRLKGMLLEIENAEARMSAPKPPRDLTWMWKELGMRRP